jgi:ABC-2 type transport system permease protein
MNALSQLGAFLRRDLLVEASYRVNWLFELGSGAVSLLVVWFLSRAIGPADALAPYGGSYFAFAVIGFAALGPTYTALTGMASRVRDAQVEGTFEALLTTPLPASRAVVFSAAWPLLSSMVRMVVLLGAAFAIADVQVHAERLPEALVVLGLAVAANGCLGVLSAAFTIVLKRGDPVARVIEQASFVLGGVLYPISVLPEPARWAAAVLPVTPALEGARKALLLGEPFSAILPQILQLAAFVAVAGPLAWLALAAALRRARVDGSLAHY